MRKIKATTIHIFFALLLLLSVLVSVTSTSNMISYCIESEDINEIVVTTKSKAKKEERRIKNQGAINEKSIF